MGSSFVDLINAPKLFTVSVTDEITGNLIPPVDVRVILHQEKGTRSEQNHHNIGMEPGNFLNGTSAKNKLI